MWHSFEQLFTASNLQLGLLIGSGVLAISLLVLALTRWGQSSPVWKCVILSFGAHILLMGYAYGTHMIFESPRLAKQPDPLRVNLVEEFGESVTNLDEFDAALPTWNESVSEQLMPEMDRLDRPEIDSELVLERATTQEIVAPKIAGPAEMALEAPQDFQPRSAPEVLPQDLTVLENNELQLESTKMEVARRGDETVATAEPPKFEAPLNVARTEINNDFQPSQQPADPTSELSPPFLSELQSESAEIASSKDLPKPAVAAPGDDFRPLRKVQPTNKMRLISNPRRLADGQPLPKMYSLRNVENRLETAKKRGGSIETEQAVNEALRWLAENQEADARWDASRFGAGRETLTFNHDRKGAGADADCGVTGLAALSFLAAGHTHLEGPYQDNLRRGFEFLVQQQKLDGNLAGDARLFAKMYCHSMSLLALSEALALTGDQRLTQPVQKGVDYSVQAQNRNDGGWRYQPGDSGDMSQFGWQVLALHSAKLGGAVVPAATFERMQNFLKECSSGVGGGLASYRPGQGPSTTMTAEALVCRYLLDKTVPPTTLMEATRRIATERPTPHHVNLYYWYYGTLAMYQTGGVEWEQWNAEMKNALLSTQIKTGTDAGSWTPDGLWGGYGGRVYSTALAALNLEVYYRYLPMSDVADAGALKLR